jgi:hypothetical protein
MDLKYTKKLTRPRLIASKLTRLPSKPRRISRIFRPLLSMNNHNAQGAGQQDYLDKAFNAGAKKFGGQKIANNRALSEKIVRNPPSCYAHAKT